MVALYWQRDDGAGDVAGDGQTIKENGPGVSDMSRRSCPF